MEYVIGVDVGGTKILAALAACGEGVEILDTELLATEAERGEPLERIGLAIDRLLGRRDLPLSGIGLALPGPVDAARGLVHECPNIPSLEGVDVRRHFGGRYGLPIGLDNDAHAAALAEARSGAGRGYSDFIYACLGTGIGCGIVIGGRLYRGADGMAGELSHIVFPGEGELHHIASGKALRARFGLAAEELVRAGDPRAEEALRHLARYIGVGLADMVTLFNPQAVVVGGGLCNLGERLLAPLEAEIRRSAFSVAARRFVFARAEHGERAGALGAVYVGLDRIHG